MTPATVAAAAGATWSAAPINEVASANPATESPAPIGTPVNGREEMVRSTSGLASDASRAAVYAGFWIRTLALLIDCAITSFGSLLIAGLAAAVCESEKIAFVLAHLGIDGTSIETLLALVFIVLYFPLMEASRLEGTLGKYMLRLRVVDQQGQRISLVRATGRYLSKFFSSAILGIGYIMAAFTDEHQALHDKLAKTYVVRRSAITPAFRQVLPADPNYGG